MISLNEQTQHTERNIGNINNPTPLSAVIEDGENIVVLKHSLGKIGHLYQHLHFALKLEQPYRFFKLSNIFSVS